MGGTSTEGIPGRNRRREEERREEEERESRRKTIGWKLKQKVYVQEEDEQEKAEPLLEITFTPDLQGPGWPVSDRVVMHSRPMNFYREPGEAVKRLREEDERREQKKAGRKSDARAAPIVRKHRIKGMGDILSELSVPPQRQAGTAGCEHCSELSNRSFRVFFS